VLNDAWEVAALHHYGEPFLEKKDDNGQQIPVTVNEGIRISAIYRDLRSKLPALSGAQQAPPSNSAWTSRGVWRRPTQAARAPKACRSQPRTLLCLIPEILRSCALSSRSKLRFASAARAWSRRRAQQPSHRARFTAGPGVAGAPATSTQLGRGKTPDRPRLFKPRGLRTEVHTRVKPAASHASW